VVVVRLQIRARLGLALQASLQNSYTRSSQRAVKSGPVGPPQRANGGGCPRYWRAAAELNPAWPVLDNRGGVLNVGRIDDPKFYQDFFSRMDKSVYLQSERL
jgi:hypothetical protein